MHWRQQCEGGACVSCTGWIALGRKQLQGGTTLAAVGKRDHTLSQVVDCRRQGVLAFANRYHVPPTQPSTTALEVGVTRFGPVPVREIDPLSLRVIENVSPLVDSVVTVYPRPLESGVTE
jgi:hypothetical protein